MRKTSGPFTFRRSIRLPGYDYRQAGVYFVTLCAQRKSKIFGTIRDGVVTLSELGEVAYHEWVHMATARPNIQLDHFVVMPNHLHGLIVICDEQDSLASRSKLCSRVERSRTLQAGSLGAIIGQYKVAVTRRAKLNGIHPGRGIWQRNYHEHIVRSEESLNDIRQYLIQNPARWGEDSLYVD